jgi:hypothetical protein
MAYSLDGLLGKELYFMGKDILDGHYCLKKLYVQAIDLPILEECQMIGYLFFGIMAVTIRVTV